MWNGYFLKKKKDFPSEVYGSVISRKLSTGVLWEECHKTSVSSARWRNRYVYNTTKNNCTIPRHLRVIIYKVKVWKLIMFSQTKILLKIICFCLLASIFYFKLVLNSNIWYCHLVIYVWYFYIVWLNN